MDVTYVRLLGVLRELYSLPRDMNRFKQYLSTMMGGTDDIVLPIVAANPMAKPHAAEKLDELLALGAEEIGGAAAQEAAERLREVPGTLKVGLVLADDTQGGWTNRYLTEAADRFGHRGGLKRNFATPLLWTSESVTPAQIREQTLGAIYRAAYQRRHGLARSLRAMLVQEMLVAKFAGMSPSLGDGDLARAREVLTRHVDASVETNYPVVFTCMYGDHAAESVGYRPLGLAPRAGFEVAQADAMHERPEPVAALR